MVQDILNVSVANEQLQELLVSLAVLQVVLEESQNALESSLSLQALPSGVLCYVD